MKISYQWLQKYFDAPLPAPEKVAEALTFHAFELDSVETAGDDTVFDIKVTPNRGHDALSHRGVAKELSVILARPMASDPLALAPDFSRASKILTVAIESPEHCRRFSAAVLKGVEVKPSPQWLQARLEAVGLRSINNVVDATNFVMMNVGQPLHAFDMDKLSGEKKAIFVRFAAEDEEIETLDGVKRALKTRTLVIGDGNDSKPLGIAGIKGGHSSEIDGNTKNIIIESANFDGVTIRKAAASLKLRTDASSRFEHELSPFLTAPALASAVELIQKIAGGEVEGYVDAYPKRLEKRTVSVSLAYANSLLGLSLSAEDVESILTRFGFSFERADESFAVAVPPERLDLTIAEDLIEEIGRIYGLANVASVMPSPAQKLEINKRFYYADAIREYLRTKGYSEVYTSSFRSAGEVELANAVASDKNFLRKDLRENLADALTTNARNAPLLGADVVQIFELGTVFPEKGEHYAFAMGVRAATPKAQKKAEDEMKQVLAEAIELLGSKAFPALENGIAELNLDGILPALKEPTAYEKREPTRRVRYDPISPYPFVLRDIALWVPKGTEAIDIERLIRDHAGPLLVRLDLFDRFEKGEQVSFAFHLVFQSREKTLTDSEVNGIMESVTAEVKSKGYAIR